MVKKNNIKNKRGFTIIEVVLVLAIAGLIFLMVFIALPALQRSQRNTQRRDDYSMLVTAVNSYMASNNGKLSNLVTDKNKGCSDLSPSRWVNSTGEDPNGNQYEVKACTLEGWGDEKPDVAEANPDGSGGGSQVFVVIKANCGGVDEGTGDPKPQNDNAARAFAVYGYLEGGSVFCQDSGSNS